MLNKKTLLLSLGTVAFAAAVYFIDRSTDSNEENTAFSTENIVQIDIERSAHPVKNVNLKLGSSWEITAPVADLADPNKISEMFDSLENVFEEKINLSEGDLNFIPPAVTLKVTTSEGKTSEFLFALDNNYQGKAYVEAKDHKGKKHIYLASGVLKKSLLQDLNYYREKRILPEGFGIFSHFQFSNQLGKFEIQKMPQGWISKPSLDQADEKFDEQKIKGILKQITDFQMIEDVLDKDQSKIDLKTQKVSLNFKSEQENWSYEISLDPKTLKVYGRKIGSDRLTILEPEVWGQIAYLNLDDFRDRNSLLRFNKNEVMPESKPEYNKLVDALHELSIFRFLTEKEKKMMKSENEFTLYKADKTKYISYQFGPSIELSVKGAKESVTLVEVQNDSAESLKKDVIGIRKIDFDKIKELLKKVKE